MTNNLIATLRQTRAAKRLRRMVGPKSRARLAALNERMDHALERVKPANRAHDMRQQAILDRYAATCAQAPLVSTTPDA